MPPSARDRIRLTGLSATGHHGVFDHERRDGQTFIADVVLHVDTRPAAAEDRLDLTVDYGRLATLVAQVLSGDPADLIETVAERIAAVALSHPGVEAVDVVLHKPGAPVPVPFTDVSVEISRDRSHVPVVEPPAAGPTVPLPAEPEQAELAVDDPEPAEHAEQAGPLGPTVPLTGPVPATGVAGAGAPAEPDATVGFSRIDELDALDVDPLEARPVEPVDVVLSLGSNLGASHETLRQAVRELAAVDGLEVTAIAPLARTAAVGGPAQADFLNTVVLGRTTLSPRQLLHACQAVEDAHERVRAERWGPRTLDVDVIVYGGTVAAAPDLELPHPRAHRRAFVLEPWAQVDPRAVLPGLGGGPVAALAQTSPDRGGIRWMALDWWQAGDRR